MAEEDIPLDITGHESRERPSEAEDDAESELAKTNGDASGAETLAEFESESGDQNGDSSAEGKDEQGEDEDEAGEVEPVEVLVGLAEDGEIDPWDIDIVDVTDKFLDRLDEADLRTSGRALFYASVLLRMKGDAMLSENEETEPEPEPWEAAIAEGEPIEEPDPFSALEQEMDRRLERKRARGTPQTLDELVRDLREAERDNWWKESREYDTSDSPSAYSRGTREMDYRSDDQFRMDDEPTAQEVTGKTHGEDIDALIDEVHGALTEQYDKGRTEVLFAEVESVGGSRVQTFLGLLFLSHRGQVRLQQDELFGDLWIKDPNAVAGSGEAVAD
ncbi:segregation/condensation protein A [Halovenus marina]|uniref:segregation/condensation protein A n=1 Tax=Halovenus marina TaxID=3396621 RepID=UPI003F54A237